MSNKASYYNNFCIFLAISSIFSVFFVLERSYFLVQMFGRIALLICGYNISNMYLSQIYEECFMEKREVDANLTQEAQVPDLEENKPIFIKQLKKNLDKREKMQINVSIKS